MTALGEWLVQEGTAKEAGKETLLQAAAFLVPPSVPHGELFLINSSYQDTKYTYIVTIRTMQCESPFILTEVAFLSKHRLMYAHSSYCRHCKATCTCMKFTQNKLFLASPLFL